MIMMMFFVLVVLVFLVFCDADLLPLLVQANAGNFDFTVTICMFFGLFHSLLVRAFF